MVSGTLTATTTPAPLYNSLEISTQHLLLQVIGTGTIIVGGKVGVTAGNGVQIQSTNGIVSFGQGDQRVSLFDVYIAATTGTVTVQWTAL